MPVHAAAPPSKLTPPHPLGPNIASEWALDPQFIFMNHGCFGARPKAVLEAQWRARLDFEARPVDWLDRHRNEHINRAKHALTQAVRMNPANFGFVANATSAINSVLRSMNFKPGDELLTTDHVYNAVRQTMKHVAARHEGFYVEAPVPLPLSHSDAVLDALAASMTSRTRIVVVDHITSPTALVFPVREIIQLCAQRGIDVLVDGAHAPGMIPLDVESLGAAYYTGNLHKWFCAPPGAAFLWVRPDRQAGIHPATISHFLDEGFTQEFNWQATRDISPWVCVEHACSYMQQLGWDRIMRHNHQMARWMQQMLCDRWSVAPSTPEDGSLMGSMATILLPQQDTFRRRFGNDILNLRDALYEKHRIEVPIVDWGGRWWIRPSCQIYNTAEQYEHLADVVLKLAEGD